MRRRTFRTPMVGLSRRRETLFNSTPSYKPRSSFKLPSGDFFLTLIIVISYLLTRVTYENQSDSEIGKKIVSFVNEKTGMKFQIPSDLRMFKMNAHYKRANKKISDVIFICLLAFFVFNLNWNNTDRFTTEHKLAWGSSVVIAPLIVNLFLEHKDKHKIDPDSVSNVKQFKDSNNQTKVFLSFALLLTLAVGVKLAHRTMVCKGGITKPVLIQIIIIGTTVGLFLLAKKDMERHKPYSDKNIKYLYEREKRIHGENFENIWIEKHKRITSNWKNELSRFDNSGDKFIPYSLIYEYGKNERLKKGFKTVNTMMKISGDKNLKKLKVKILNLQPHHLVVMLII